jgi:hypothetical protein
MAREKTPATKSAKEPGRLKQMYQVFQMTRRNDSTAIWWMALGFLGPIAVALILGFILSGSNPLSFALWVVTGVLAGILVFLIVLGRRAEKAAYSQIAGQPGAVGAVLKSSLRRGWTASEMPVAVSPRTQDAVYRAVGPGGVVLIGEGPQSRTHKMLDEERRRIARVLPNVVISQLHVGPDADSIPLHKLAGRMARAKSTLSKAEVYTVSNRLNSHTSSKLPIPKGIDPTKARAQRRA